MSGPSQLPAIVTDRYAVEKEIGSGGMATVYLARDLRHDREVALKVLRPELGIVLGADRFLSEIKITARLDHPHILTLIDSGAADGLLYYVLPFVRGESLRDKLDRETQLSIEDALSFARQIGSALEYAHRHGVIHRDIKPENILIQEGEAILADFGIALAVKEAGGSRLTETGLSLGTPQYMSPEQATGDRALDSRSDQYSLAAVLYEMLTGEPPLTGATSQAVIAKLLTEPPTHIRTIRKTVPENVDAAVAKGLAKIPADRFASVGDFVRALDARSGTDAITSVPTASRKRRLMAIAGVTAAIAVAAAFGMTFLRDRGPAANPLTLRDRRQVTFSGNVITPAMSADGKQMAYFVKTCPTEKCTYSIVVQDVGGTEARKIFNNATSGDQLGWSPDRRYLLFAGTVNNRYGGYIISAVGGTPRYIGTGAIEFYAGGDSLLLGSNMGLPDPDSTYTLKVTSLAGDLGRKWKIPGGGEGIRGVFAIPGSTRILALTVAGGKGIWQIIDTSGNATDRLVNSCVCGGVMSSDAAWMIRSASGGADAIVRIGIDVASGRFAARQDTVFTGRFSNFSVTSDGTRLALDEGTDDYTVVAMPLADMFARKFGEATPLMKSSTRAWANIAPDGNRILKQQVLPGDNGASQVRLTVAPFGGGNETRIETEGNVGGSDWSDSVTVFVSTQNSKGLSLRAVDVRNGQSRNEYQLSDSAIASLTALPNGWAWIPRTFDRIIVMENGQRREIKKPAWFQALFGVSVSYDRKRLMYWGWNTGTNDSIGYEMVPVGGGTPTRMYTSFAERGSGSWLNDGTFVARVWDTPESVSLFKLKAPNQAESIGTIPHLTRGITHSADLKRATVMWMETRNDAWMYRVAH